MAEHVMEVECGDKKWFISHNGETVYCGSDKGSSLWTLKNVKFKKNQLVHDGKSTALTEAEICAAISKKE